MIGSIPLPTLPNLPPLESKAPLTDISLYGTEVYPIRPSNIAQILRCDVLAMLEAIADTMDTGGPAADIGSVTHAGIAAFHKTTALDEKVAAGFAAMQNSLPKFPLADYNEAKIYFSHYAKDPRNVRAVCLAVEQPVTFSIPCHKWDSTGQPIVISGTLDQVREMDNQLFVMDYKTGGQSKSITQVMSEHLFQLSAYLIGARHAGYPVTGAKIIRGYAYRKRDAMLPSPIDAFIELPIDEERAMIMLQKLQLTVAKIRSGEIHFGPATECSFCPMRGPDNCIPIARQKFGF